MMTTIEQALKQTCRLHPSPQYIEDIHANTLLKTLCAKHHLTLVPVYSTKLYPKILTLDESQYLIWDNHFWNLYQHYLHIIETSIQSDIPNTILEKNALSLTYIALANVTDKYPSLSLAVTLIYKHEIGDIFTYNEKFFSTRCCETPEIVFILSQIYVLSHELIHKKIKDSAGLYENQINEFIKNYKISDLPPVRSLDDQILFDTFTELHRAINAKNTNVFEELYCDLHAALETMEAAKKMLDRSFPINKILYIVLNIVNQTNYYQSWIKQLEEAWNIIYRKWRKVSSEKYFKLSFDDGPPTSYTEASIRTSFSCLILSNYLTKTYNIRQNISLMKTDVFDRVSKHILNHSSVLEILNTEKKIRQNYSDHDARKMRDNLLCWK